MTLPLYTRLQKHRGEELRKGEFVKKYKPGEDEKWDSSEDFSYLWRKINKKRFWNFTTQDWDNGIFGTRLETIILRTRSISICIANFVLRKYHLEKKSKRKIQVFLPIFNWLFETDWVNVGNEYEFLKSRNPQQ